jgi:hypothetical protein
MTGNMTAFASRPMRVRVIVDTGFGNAIEPGLAETALPVVLDFPAPRLRSDVRETIIAEKSEAMVVVGAPSRMKDLYDIWLLAQTHEFTDDKLAPAIAATFKRRGTAIPEELPDCLTRAFAFGIGYDLHIDEVEEGLVFETSFLQ